ncbi:MAG: vitamin B12 dependent-methionine synthase activation domain-containing protein [Chloroflexota bacterium]|nr:vitamin B12 dependent-methionine synthase activation domain-containing protein [Chloroflexota bacterium]
MEVLDSIPVSLDFKEVMNRLRNHSELEPIVQELLDAVRPVARPKAVYDVCYLDERGPDWVTINGVRFASHVLRGVLDEEGRVFPYVATCGTEVDQITVPADDLVRAYCLDIMKRMLVTSARAHLENYLVERYALGKVSKVSPGELLDWPLPQQKELFSLIGDVEGLIGVKLTESFLMVPIKSVSGMFFATEVKFEACQLCLQPKCESRRAPYSPAMVAEYRAKAGA